MSQDQAITQDLDDWEVKMFTFDFKDEFIREPKRKSLYQIENNAQDLIDFQRDKERALVKTVDFLLKHSVKKSKQDLMLELDKLGCEKYEAIEYFKVRGTDIEPHEGDILSNAIGQTVDKPFHSGWCRPDCYVRFGV